LRFDITKPGTERSLETIRNKRICFGSFGIYRNWNVSVLSVVLVQSKKNRKNRRERQVKGDEREMEGKGKGKERTKGRGK
jgi:hypothetical protein